MMRALKYVCEIAVEDEEKYQLYIAISISDFSEETTK